MTTQQTVIIVYGSIELVRQPSKKGKGLPLTATVSDVVFRNCAETITNNLVLQRAVKRLRPDLRKLDGWTIAALHPAKELGIAVPNASQNIGE